MLEYVEILVTAASALGLLVSLIWAVEIIAAVLPAGTRPDLPDSPARPNVAILIPAHNEEDGIQATLDSIGRELRQGDRLTVVADNCTDGTAALARALGAVVVERHDSERRGKGYALEFGIEQLRRDPPAIVIVIDADCALDPGAIDRLALAVASTNRPVQSLDLIEVEPDAPIQQRISALAFRVRNFVRFAGLKRLGLPCPLAGTGMAFPWAVIQKASLESADIVEDLKLGIDLAICGEFAVFEPRAVVTSRFPATGDGQQAQRRRWEHGHLRTIFREAPRLIYESVRQRRLDLLGMALDLLVPPLSLHVLILALLVAVSALLIPFGAGGAALWLATTATGLTGLGFLLAWYVFGRTLLSAADLIAIPCYIAGKFPIYLHAVFNREDRWVRSPRRNENDTC